MSLVLAPLSGFASAEPMGSLAQLALRALCARDNANGFNEALQAMGTVPLHLFTAVVEVRCPKRGDPHPQPVTVFSF
jgi:hypothetical protein